MVLLLENTVPCNTCKGTSPSVWNCNPIDLMEMGGGYHRFISLRGDLASHAGSEKAIQVPVPAFESMGSPWQMVPRLQELGGVGISITMFLVVQLKDQAQKDAWSEGRFEPQREDITMVLVSLQGPINKNLHAVTRFMEEGHQRIGPVFWHLVLYPQG